MNNKEIFKFKSMILEFADRIYSDDMEYQIYTRKELKEELNNCNDMDSLLDYFAGMIDVCIDLYRNSLKAF